MKETVYFVECTESDIYALARMLSSSVEVVKRPYPTSLSHVLETDTMRIEFHRTITRQEATA